MLDLFTLQVPPDRCHPNFVSVLQKPFSFAEVLLDWSDGFVDRDGKFVIEFQTSFNASFWELYVLACLKQMGYTVDFSYRSPDFVVLRDGQPVFCIEAVIASNAMDKTPEWKRRWEAGMKLDLHGVIDEGTIRFANAITSKYDKYRKSYSAIPVIGSLPFIVACASFDQPLFFKESFHPPLRVLYGADPWHWDGTTPPKEIPSITKNNGTDIPLGYFTQRTMPEISAVMYSNVATAGKVAALSREDPDFESVFVGVMRMDGEGQQTTRMSVPKAEHKENLLDGLHVFHNPRADYQFPIDRFLFDGISQWGWEIATRTPFRKGSPEMLLQRAFCLNPKS